MDYASEKIYELEKRVKRLEKIMAIPPFNNYFSVKFCEEAKKEHIFKFSFISYADCYLKLISDINCTGGFFTASYYVNGIFAKNEKFYSALEQFSAYIPVAKGKVDVTVKLNFNVDNTIKLIFSTCGYIGFDDDDSVLSYINEKDYSLILFLDGDTLFVKKYADNKISDIYSESGVKNCAICKIADKYMLTVVDKSGNMTCKTFDIDFNLLKSRQIMSDIGSVCAIGGIKAILFAVKGSYVYKYTMDEELNFTEENTQYRAKRVVSNPGVSDCIILIDFDGNGKLVSL